MHDRAAPCRATPPSWPSTASSAQAAIDALVADLTPDQAEVVLLRIVGGLSVEEVATLTARSPGAVRVLQHRALNRLSARAGSVTEGSPAVTR